ncbi:hypothetical protein JTB14_006696 [Gonioctena quinquepunctata]|nr:hypothetical protein JTB14_006696 [Gonioctena quinquepunctata]
MVGKGGKCVNVERMGRNTIENYFMIATRVDSYSKVGIAPIKGCFERVRAPKNQEQSSGKPASNQPVGANRSASKSTDRPGLARKVKSHYKTVASLQESHHERPIAKQRLPTNTKRKQGTRGVSPPSFEIRETRR